MSDKDGDFFTGTKIANGRHFIEYPSDSGASELVTDSRDGRVVHRARDLRYRSDRLNIFAVCIVDKSTHPVQSRYRRRSLSNSKFLIVAISMVIKSDRQFGTFVLAAIFFASSQVVFADSPAGVYRGEWTSGSTGHHGPMRVVVQPRTDGTYQARFTGRFALVIPFAYRVTLQPTQDAFGNNLLTAEKPLGPIMGSYRMTAQANQSGFSGSFQAAGDNGSIQMQRVR